MKTILSNLSQVLLKLHRELLLYQVHQAEKEDRRKYSPYDLLKLSLEDTRFAWLKKFSSLIVKIDTITDDKKNIPYDAFELIHSIRETISIDKNQSSEFIKALQSESSLMISLGSVRKVLMDAELSLKSKIN